MQAPFRRPGGRHDSDQRTHFHPVTDDEFLSASSQALRTRFTTLTGFWQLLDRRLLRSANVPRDDQVVPPLRKEFQRFQALLLQYLDAADLHWGDDVTRNQPVNLAELSQDALADIERRGLVSPRHHVQMYADPDVVGSGDRRWLHDALEHVIANALLYSPDGGETRVTIARDEDTALVTVQDQGIGVHPDERERIFHPFYRGQHAQEVASGLGLGLFIAGSAFARHGGTIEVGSEPGGGSRFTVRLPLQVPTDMNVSA